MRPIYLTTEHINTLIEQQLESWPLASENFGRLREVKRRQVPLGALPAGVQCNPARIVSTGASVDKASIAARPCFLCASNRPDEQITTRWIDGWDLLVNPFPILPVHFTVASVEHKPQGAIPLDMATMAESAEGLAFFYNGARAGASAPDHRHAQAVLAAELPILRIAEQYHTYTARGFVSSESFGIDLPFHFISGIIAPDADGMAALSLVPGAFGIDDATGMPDRGLVNAFFHIDKAGLLRIVIVPRRRHRPSCYDASSADRFVISPGAIDMAGLMIAPRQEDYERLDEDKIRDIYAEVAFADHLPETINRYFRI